MMKSICKGVIFFVALISLGGTASTSVGDGPFETDLIASQHYDVGDVIVWNDADYVYVNLRLDIVWIRLLETHVHVAADLEDIPQSNGNPTPGQFEYKVVHGRWVQEYTQKVRRHPAWVAGSDVCVAVHAVITGICGISATGWGDGPNFPSSDQNWATYIVYTIE